MVLRQSKGFRLKGRETDCIIVPEGTASIFIKYSGTVSSARLHKGLVVFVLVISLSIGLTMYLYNTSLGGSNSRNQDNKGGTHRIQIFHLPSSSEPRRPL